MLEFIAVLFVKKSKTRNIKPQRSQRTQRKILLNRQDAKTAKKGNETGSFQGVSILTFAFFVFRSFSVSSVAKN
jgi:hypothetical protein